MNHNTVDTIEYTHREMTEYEIREEAENLLIDLGRAMERYGKQMGTVSILLDPDGTFMATSSPSEVMVTLDEGEARGEVVFIYAYKPERKVERFQHGPWALRIQRLAR